MDENLYIKAIKLVLSKNNNVNMLLLDEFKLIDENTSIDNDNGELIAKSNGGTLQFENDINFATYLYQFTIGVLLPQTYEEETMYAKTSIIRKAFRDSNLMLTDPTVYDIGPIVFSSSSIVQHTDNIQYRELNFQNTVIERL